MKYYAIIEDGIINTYSEDIGLLEHFSKPIVEIDYQPIFYKGIGYTKEKFEEIKATQEYKDEEALSKKFTFDNESKKITEEASIISYQDKEISLEEILFKSTIYNSVTDTVVYLKTLDSEIIKINRVSFLLLVAKAKSNLKATEEALYNAENNYDGTKDNLASLKEVLEAINKIFNS